MEPRLEHPLAAVMNEIDAQSTRGRMTMQCLYVRQGAPWFADLRAELLSFSAGKHDDQVDALGLVGQLLDKINVGQKPKPPDAAQSFTGSSPKSLSSHMSARAHMRGRVLRLAFYTRG